MPHIRKLIATPAALLLLVASACSRDNGTPASAEAHTPGGASPGAAAPTGAASNGSGPTITLASADIAAVGRSGIEEAVAVTGDLHPIESVQIRARLEGDLVGLYVLEGQRVRAGQLLARFEDSEQQSNLASAQADQVAAESEVSTAQWNLEQTTELFRAGAVAERDFKMAEQTLVAAKARLAAAAARVRATSSIVADTKVLAPTTGTIATRAVENGEHVARGDDMFTMVRSDVLELAAAVPARQAGGVRVGQTVHFTADGRTFDGRVARISPTVDPASRSVTVYVQVPNQSLAIKGGTFATGRVVSRVVPNALVIPAAAVRQSPDDGTTFVYRISGRVLDVAPVLLGIVDQRAGVAEVVQGLSEGDRVIVGNVGTLGRGMQVIVAGEEANR